MKSFIPELASTTAFDGADLKAMQKVFEKACAEMGLEPGQVEERSAAAQAIFAAYQGGERREDALLGAAYATGHRRDSLSEPESDPPA